MMFLVCLVLCQGAEEGPKWPLANKKQHDRDEKEPLILENQCVNNNIIYWVVRNHLLFTVCVLLGKTTLVDGRYFLEGLKPPTSIEIHRSCG